MPPEKKSTQAERIAVNETRIDGMEKRFDDFVISNAKQHESIMVAVNDLRDDYKKSDRRSDKILAAIDKITQASAPAQPQPPPPRTALQYALQKPIRAFFLSAILVSTVGALLYAFVLTNEADPDVIDTIRGVSEAK